ncbi:MAG: imidazolonepropionase [Myxococcota bacterium]
MHDWDLLLTDARLATMCAGGERYGTIEGGAVAIANGALAWVGPAESVPKKRIKETRSLAGRWVTPALIDCHTHLVFAGDRAKEFEARLSGTSYEAIAAAGGGIRSTVRATRDATLDGLVAQSAIRFQALRAEGVGTIEIKSGYGLDRDTESRMLAAAGALGERYGGTVFRTFLGAHTVPDEYQGRASDYVSFLVNEALPHAHGLGLVDAVDAYCEGIAFSPEELRPLFECAASLGLPVKLHADQLSDGGGAAFAATIGALSADHLEYTCDAGVRALAAAGTAAVLLPGAFLTLRETQLPPVEALRTHRVPIALASDCNPGTSPIASLRAAMHLATALFRLTPEECLAGVTREAARALGLGDRGTLAVGKRADLAVWDIDHPAELTYWLGTNPLSELYLFGRPASG